jgi:tRNA A37 threonylcarbamoyladenosine dehydratase
MTLQYDMLYQRNIGIFTEAEQATLKSAKVFIAGAGGIGGIQAMVLARMGIGELSLMDPGVFDEPDMNRQYAATVSTLGVNKAVATAKMLQEAAPFIKVNIFTTKLSESKLAEQVRDCALVIDAIDLADFPYKSLFAKVARQWGKYNLCSPIPDLGTVLIIFDPKGMDFEEFTQGKSYPPITETAIKKYRENLKQGGGKSETGIPFLSSISTNSAAAALSAALLATEAALMIVGQRKAAEIVTVPHITYIDLLRRSFRIFNPLDNI